MKIDILTAQPLVVEAIIHFAPWPFMDDAIPMAPNVGLISLYSGYVINSPLESDVFFALQVDQFSSLALLSDGSLGVVKTDQTPPVGSILRDERDKK